jgi:hypothetical protein
MKIVLGGQNDRVGSDAPDCKDFSGFDAGEHVTFFRHGKSPLKIRSCLETLALLPGRVRLGKKP